MYLALLLLILLGSLALVAFLVAYHPKAHDCLDLCEVCGKPATHELAGPVREHRQSGGASAMVATYCRKDAPAHAVKVR